MGDYAVAVQKLARTIAGLITDSLGLGPNHLTGPLDHWMQIMAVNCFLPCPAADRLLGLPSHSDYDCITVVLNDSPGLEVLDSEDGAWKPVPVIPGALQVLVGDQIEVMSNGRYRSVVVVVAEERTRVSIASLHSLGMDVKMEPASELVNPANSDGYRRSCLRDFLYFIAANDVSDGRRFLNTLRRRAS